MSLRIDTDRDVVIAHVTGEVDLANASTISADISSQVPNNALGVVLDLTDTTYFDSSGVQLVFDLFERLRRRQQGLRLSVPEGAPIRRVLGVVRLDETVPILPTVEEAVAELRSGE